MSFHFRFYWLPVTCVLYSSNSSFRSVFNGRRLLFIVAIIYWSVFKFRPLQECQDGFVFSSVLIDSTCCVCVTHPTALTSNTIFQRQASVIYYCSLICYLVSSLAGMFWCEFSFPLWLGQLRVHDAVSCPHLLGLFNGSPLSIVIIV